jgi:hypothetical protein
MERLFKPAAFSGSWAYNRPYIGPRAEAQGWIELWELTSRARALDEGSS